jgi:hypothetical protein
MGMIYGFVNEMDKLIDCELRSTIRIEERGNAIHSLLRGRILLHPYRWIKVSRGI